MWFEITCQSITNTTKQDCQFLIHNFCHFAKVFCTNLKQKSWASTNDKFCRHLWYDFQSSLESKCSGKWLLQIQILGLSTFNEKGCSNKNCAYFHPNACRDSLKTKTCPRSECRFYHLTGTKRGTRNTEYPKSQNFSVSH